MESSENNNASVLETSSIVERYARVIMAQKKRARVAQAKLALKASELIKRSSLPKETRYQALHSLLVVLDASLVDKEKEELVFERERRQKEEREKERQKRRKNRITRIVVALTAFVITLLPAFVPMEPETEANIRFYIVLVAYVFLDDPLFDKILELIKSGKE